MVWSDEYQQFEYRGKMYRLLTMRIANAASIVDRVVGIFPAGMSLLTPWNKPSRRNLTLRHLPQSNHSGPLST